MTKDTVVAFRAPDGFSLDPLTDLLRQGARDLIAQAVEAELNTFLAAHADLTDGAGHRRLVRHGHLPERDVQTGIGAMPVKVPRVRNRFPGARTGDCSKALVALLGPDAPGVSASTITRLKADRWDDYERRPKHDLSERRYVYFAARSFGSGRTGSISHPVSMKIASVCW